MLREIIRDTEEHLQDCEVYQLDGWQISILLRAGSEDRPALGQDPGKLYL